MKKTLMSIASVGLVLAAVQANAGTEAGKFELSGTLADDVQVTGTGSGGNVLIAAAGFGYFVTSAIEIKGTVAGAWATGSGSSSTSIAFIAGPDYHFNLGADSKLVPYVGVYGGGVYVTSSGNSSFYPEVDAHVGVKYFVTERTSLNAQISYQEVFENSNDIGTLVTTLGISYFF